MVGHYNSCNASCLAKDCHCTQDNLLQFPPKCKPMRWLDLQQCETVEEVFDLYESHNLISERDMDAILHDELFARSISKHPTKNAFDGLPLADPYQGIIGMTPQEFLHMMGGFTNTSLWASRTLLVKTHPIRQTRPVSMKSSQFQCCMLIN